MAAHADDYLLNEIIRKSTLEIIISSDTEDLATVYPPITISFRPSSF